MAASDSFIGEGLKPSPYQELKAERDELLAFLDRVVISLEPYWYDWAIDEYKELRTKYK